MLTHPTPGVISRHMWRHRTSSMWDYRSTFDDVTDEVIVRNVGGLLGDVIPLNLTDRLYIIIEYYYIIKFKKYQREAVREGWREGGNSSEAG